MKILVVEDEIGIANFLKQGLEEENYERTRQNSEKKRKDLEDFVNRFRAKASKAVQAQSRLKLLEKMPEMEALSLMASLDFEFNYQECPGKILANQVNARATPAHQNRLH